MSESRDYLEISSEAIRYFCNDGRLDASEMAALVAIAERDGRIDANEMRVLLGVIKRLRPEEMDAAMRAEIDALAQKVGTRLELTESNAG